MRVWATESDLIFQCIRYVHAMADKSVKSTQSSALGIFLYMCCAIIIFVLLRVFVFSMFSVPSDSMMPALQSGDKIIVEKISTGARLFNIISASKGKNVKIIRVPGWRHFLQGDILVFNFPYAASEDSISMDYHKYFVKRCIGMPGDTIEIRDFEYYVNNILFNKTGAKDGVRRSFPADSIARATISLYSAFTRDIIDDWTIRDFGPLYIPRRGYSLKIDTLNYLRYKSIIEWETKDVISKESGKLLLGNKVFEEYTFKDNYYFMGGDNSMDSNDSRYWGLLPESFIVGRVRVVWWSKRGKLIRWDRVLKGVK